MDGTHILATLLGITLGAVVAHVRAALRLHRWQQKASRYTRRRRGPYAV